MTHWTMLRFQPVINSLIDTLSMVEHEKLGDTLSAIKFEAFISTLAAKKLKVHAELLLNTLGDVEAESLKWRMQGN